MRKIRKIGKRVFAAMLAAAMIFTTPGMASYAEAEEAQTEGISESVTLQEDDVALTNGLEEPEKAEAAENGTEKAEADDSDTEKPEEAESDTEKPEEAENGTDEPENGTGDSEEAEADADALETPKEPSISTAKEDTEGDEQGDTGAEDAVAPKSADNADDIAPVSRLYVLGNEVVNGSVTSGDGWSYDKETNTLTLDNLTVTADDYPENVTKFLDLGANANGRCLLNVYLKGANRIDGVGYGENDFIFYRTYLALKITGDDDASLTLNGMVQGDFRLISGKINCTINTQGPIFINYGMSIDGGATVVFNCSYGETWKDAYYSVLSQAAGGIFVKNNSTLEINSTNPSHQCSLMGFGPLTIEDSTLTLKNVYATGVGTYFLNPWPGGGVRTDDTVTIKNSTVNLDTVEGLRGYSIDIANSTINTAEKTALALRSMGGDVTLTDTELNGLILESGTTLKYTVIGKANRPTDFTLTEGRSLTIPEGASLNIPDGVTLTNNGTMRIHNKASLTGEGTLEGTGSFLIDVTENLISIPEELVYTGTDLADQIKLEKTVTVCGTEFTADLDADEWTRSISPSETVIDAGEYTVTFTKGDASISKTFTVAQSGTDLESEGRVQTYNGEAATSDFTASDTITVIATPAANGVAPQKAARLQGDGVGTPTAGQMALFVKDTQISESVSAGADGSYTMTVSASDVLTLGEVEPNGDPVPLTVKFVGNDNMADAAATVEVNISAVAKVEIGSGSAYYGTIDDAWAAALDNTATVTLLDDVTTSAVLSVPGGSDITFNGGAYSLISSNTRYGALCVEGGKLTVNGGKVTATGEGVAGVYCGSPIFGSGELVVCGGEFYGTGSSGYGLMVSSDATTGSVKLSGGSFTGSAGSVYIDSASGTLGALLLNYDSTDSDAVHYAYFNEEGKAVTDILDQKELTDSVTVKECMNHVYTEQSYSHVKGSLTHKQTCTACGSVEEVDCEYTEFGETYNIKVCACGATLTASLTDADNLVYNGERQKPGATFMVDDVTPREVRNQKTYTYNKDAGTGTLAVIDVEGVFYGFLRLEFTIAKAVPVVTWNGESTQTLTYTGQEAAVTADVQLVNNETGTVNYSYAKQGSDSYISGLPIDVGNYLVKASFAEQTNYVAAEAELELTIDKADASISTAPTALTLIYNGEAQKLVTAGTANFGDVVYAAEKNGTYSTTIPTGTDAGSYTVWYKVEDHNNYNGVAAEKLDVTISPKLVGNPTIELTPDTFEYDGQDKTPGVTVKDGDTVIPDSEYTVEYSDNRQIGEATVMISNVEGNYIVNGSKTFEITKPSLETAEVTLSETFYIYDGTAKIPDVTVKKGGVLVPEDQYVCTYSNTNGGDKNHTNVGTVTVTVTAKADGQYSGSYSVTFTIAAAELMEVMVTLSEESVTYNGTEQKPAINVKQEDGTTLAEGTDYEVVYSTEDFTNAGTVTITIKGIGNYVGTVEKTYVIKQAAPTIAWSNTTQELTYTGQPTIITPPVVTLVNNESFDGKISYSYAVSGNSYTDGLPVNAGIYKVRAAIAEQANYTAAESMDMLTLTVNKAEGTLTLPDTPINKKYGDADFSLECTANGDGAISYASDNEAVVKVSEDGMVQIKGAGEATVTVSLSEGKNYTAAADRIITIIVSRSGNAPDMPDSVMIVPVSCLKVGDVPLPENWEWREEDRDKSLQTGTGVEAVAVYTGADKGNYENETVTVMITRSSCDHVAGDILYTGEGEKAPTCTETGLGHQECVKCHAVIQSGIVVEALGHDYTSKVTKEPTTSEEGELTYTCSRCGDTYTETIPKKIPEGLWISGLAQSIPYTGSAIKAEGIRVYHGSTLLREKTEYTISYKSNTNAGTAQLIVTGKGSYRGKAIAEFTIESVNLSTDSGILATIATVTETGKNLKPAVSVTWNGKKLKEKKDYTLSYETGIRDASEEGYAVTISGIGNYAGSIEGRFYVKPRGTKLLNSAKVTGIKKSYEYDHDAQNGEESGGQNGSPEGQNVAPKGLESDLANIIVKVGTTILTKDTDYTVRTESTDAVGIGYVVIEPTQTSTYAGEKRIPFNITGTNIKKCFITGLAKSYPYTGEPVMPEIKVYTGKNGTGTQIPADVYTVQYSNYTNQGKATVSVTGIPEKGCLGSVKATYSIGKLDLATEKDVGSITVTMPDNIKYAKGGAKPQPVITYRYNGTVRTLREGVDYTLKYSNNTTKYSSTSSGSTQKPTLKITGIGNYSGTITEYFDIAAQDIGKLEITAADKAYNSKKNGGYYYSVPKVYDLDGKQLKSGKDYTVQYTNETTGQLIGKTDPVANGTQILVTVTAKDNSCYEGALSTTYLVRDAKDVKDISKAKNDKIAAQQYTGSGIEPEVKLYMMNGKTKSYLTEEDYEIIGYYNNIKRGTATVIIRGTGNWSGVKSITFKIASADNKLIWSGIF